MTHRRAFILFGLAWGPNAPGKPLESKQNYAFFVYKILIFYYQEPTKEPCCWKLLFLTSRIVSVFPVCGYSMT